MNLRRLLPPKHRLAPSLICTGILAALLMGCAGPRPAPKTVPIPGYEGLQEELNGRDLSAFEGRRIVLDPGHGGHFRGALGPNGLTEAEVNLGVALNLRGLLEWAGAQVWLTRSANTDFLSPADSSLASDLAVRVYLSDSLQPDVFLSIHHNSTANLNRTINETQTYYPLDDDGASLDLARSIHRHLVLNLGIRPASIRPGNFHVLRNATVPAVLGEPAMISHPVMAERLSLAASQRLEAEAYFLGLLDYFSGGLPRWSGAATDTIFWGGSAGPDALAFPILNWHFDAGTRPARSTPGPDPAHTQLTLDGRRISPRLSPDARTVSWQLPDDLTAVPHVLELQGRNLNGRATPRRRTVLLPRAAATVQVQIIAESSGQRNGLSWRPAGNGPTGNGPAPQGVLRWAPGKQIVVGPDSPRHHLLTDPVPDGASFTFHPRDGDWDATPCPVERIRLEPGKALHLITLNGHPYSPPLGWRARVGASGQSAWITSEAASPLWLEGPGVQPLIDPEPNNPSAPRTMAGAAAHWEAAPLLPGLMGKVILLDPAGGGTNTEGAGPLGLRGADLNLATAQQAAQLLRGAGAVVHLTRSDETALLPMEKVRLAGQLHADLFLTIGRRAAGEPRMVRHHPGSTVGQAWAKAALKASAALPQANGSVADSCRQEASSGYLLRHTACPALEWRLDLPQSAQEELRQLHPSWHRAEARAILLAAAAISGHPAVFDHPLHMDKILRDLAIDGGLPVAEVDWVQVDGNWPWTPLVATGPFAAVSKSVSFNHGPHLPGLLGRHVLEIHAGDRWQVWLLERPQVQAGDRWQRRLLLSGAD